MFDHRPLFFFRPPPAPLLSSFLHYSEVGASATTYVRWDKDCQEYRERSEAPEPAAAFEYVVPRHGKIDVRHTPATPLGDDDVICINGRCPFSQRAFQNKLRMEKMR